MWRDPHVISSVILITHWLIALVLSFRVITHRLPIGVSLAWLTVILALPYAGAITYYIFGSKRFDKDRIIRQEAVWNSTKTVFDFWQDHPKYCVSTVGKGEAVFRQALGAIGAPALTGNTLSLLNQSHNIFDALIKDINAAEVSCKLLFYIWLEGGQVEAVQNALIRASERGVRCKVLVDAVGSKDFLESLSFTTLKSAGIEVTPALPRSIWRRADLRNHRKIAVIDDKVGYVGSLNMADPADFKKSAGVGQWVDAVVRIEGPAINMLATVFDQDWALETKQSFDPPKFHEIVASAKNTHSSTIQVVPSGPIIFPDAIRELLLTALYSASTSVTISTPYFVPDDAILTALISLARRGVEVTLILPEKNDSVLVRYASAASFDYLISAGVRIALFQSGLLHTKSMVVDNELTIFGSVNLDMRSFWLNFEISLFVYDHNFASEIKKLQNDYLEQSVFVDEDEWNRRSAYKVFMGNAIRLVGPLL